MRIITQANVTARKTVNLEDQHKQEVIDKINYLMAIAKTKFGYTAACPSITYDLRGKTAGYAWFKRNHIQLNPVLMMENFDHFINNVIGHELAHLIAYATFRDDGHGYYWRHVMMSLGLDPNRTHRYNVSNVGNNMTYHIYTCGCHETLAPVRRHNNIQKGTWRYYPCEKCGSNFRYTGKTTTRNEIKRTK